MKRESIKFMEIPTRYPPVIDRLRLHMDPHYIEWRGGRYWVMEHRWDDMVDDIHLMINSLKEKNKGELPPDLILRRINIQQKVDQNRKTKDPNILLKILDVASDMLIWII